ncbi:integrase, catalytic region, zinc finger, CCHC-type containing protein [Tanacetum coccineum]
MVGSQYNKYRGHKVKVIQYKGEGHRARQCTQPKRPSNAAWYKEKAMLAKAQEGGHILDEDQLAFLVDPGVRDGQVVQTIIPNNAAFQTEDLNTYYSDYDDILNAKAVLMANISNYSSNVVSEVPHSETYLNDMENQSVHAMQDFEQTPAVDFTNNEIHSDSNIILEACTERKADSLKHHFKQIKEKECLLQTFNVFKSVSKEKEEKYMENEIDLEKKIKDLDNIIYKVGQSAQTVHMLTKPQAFYDNIHKQALGYQNPFYLRKAQRIKPTLYDGIVISDNYVAMLVIDDEEILILEEESRSKILSEDFGKCFTLQQELSVEQAFWLCMSNPTSKPSYASPIKIEAPKELPNVSLVNESLKKLKFHLARFDNMVKIRTTPDARTEEFFEKNDLNAQLQDKNSTICKLKDIIKSMGEKSKDENVNYDYGEIVSKNVELENRKEIADIAAQIPSASTIFPGMFKLDLEPLAPRLLQNREAHLEYLKYTQEQDDILWEIVEQAKVKQPLDSVLDFACKHAQRIQELLVYIRDTCPNANKLSTKKVDVTPKNNIKKVRFAEPLTSSSNIKQVESSKSSDSNTPVLSSIGLKCSTSKCGSKPIGNKRNDRISQTPSINMKNKVEARPRKVVQIVLWYLDSGCMKHMTGNRSQLMNFVSKFLGTVKFGNDNIARIMRFLRTKDEAPEAIIKCIKNIQVRLNATIRNVRTDNGTEFVNQTLHEFYENVGISHQTSVARTPQQNGIVERRNQTLVEAARTMLIFSKAPLFLWAEAINTACYTQNRSLIRLRYNKTPYELMQDKKPDLSFFHVFGALCYPTNDNDDLGKLDAKADIGLVPNTVSQQPCIPPPKDDWDHLFQPMFNEYFNPPSIAVTPVQDAAAPRAMVLADSPVSTSIDQDAPSTSIPSTQEQEHSLNISQGFEESQKTPTFCDDPLHEELTSQGSSHLDPNRMPLTKAKGQIPQKDKYSDRYIDTKIPEVIFPGPYCPTEAAIEGNHRFDEILNMEIFRYDGKH